MTLEDELRLSFYKEVAVIDERHDVYLVESLETHRFYVKKRLRACDPSVLRKIRENRYPHIPQILELIPDGEDFIVIEEHIDGESLEERLQSGTFSMEETKPLILQLCDILAPLHACDPPIIHRDIKPSNLIISHDQLYLIDFDASKSYDPAKSRDTVLMGTQEYAAPEQFGFSQSSPRTDIYAMGVLMNKMLTGCFPSEKLWEGEGSEVIRKCLSMDPRDRYDSVGSLAGALRREQSPADRSWLPPGFRTGNPLHMIVAGSAFFVWLWISWTTEYLDNGKVLTGRAETCYQIATMSLGILWGLYIFNYRGFRDRFPFRKNPSRILNFLRILLGLAILFLLPVLFLTIAL